MASENMRTDPRSGSDNEEGDDDNTEEAGGGETEQDGKQQTVKRDNPH